MRMTRDFVSPRESLTTGRPHPSQGLPKLALLALLGFLANTGPAAEIYTFEELAANEVIDGQDGWRTEPNLGQAVIFQDASGNGTKVARYSKTAVFNQPAHLTRLNDATFNFVPFTGRETNAIIQFEANGEYVAIFALGRDLNGDGLLTGNAGELGPSFGVSNRNFHIQEANLGAVYEDGFNEGGGDGNSGNDWYRLQLRLDFTAADGDGIGSLHFMNLTDGHTAFHTVSGMRNRPLGLKRLSPEAGPSTWNGMRLELLSNGNNIPSVDNLRPNLQSIFITRILVQDTDAVLNWRGGTGPYQVQRRFSLGTGSWEDVGSVTALTSATNAIAGATAFFRVVQP